MNHLAGVDRLDELAALLDILLLALNVPGSTLGLRLSGSVWMSSRDMFRAAWRFALAPRPRVAVPRVVVPRVVVPRVVVPRVVVPLVDADEVAAVALPRARARPRPLPRPRAGAVRAVLAVG